MTELSGTLEGVGLPAIVRFLAGLQKTGCLRITHQDWHGDVYFDAGQIVSATLGKRQGLSALDALVQALPGGSFVFDDQARLSGASTVQLTRDELQAHLDELTARSASGGPTLPSLDAIPHLVPQDNEAAAEETVPLDRGTLQTLLAVDGQRSVREIISVRGSFEALWQIANLAEVGLVRMPPVEVRAAPAPKPVEVTPPPRSSSTRGTRTVDASVPVVRTPVAVASVPASSELVNVHCPKLGFEDDATSSFGRPTRLHRCFAAGTPLPLSLDQQRELCLSDQFGTCPRLAMAGLAPIGIAAEREPLSAAPTPRLPEPESTLADDPRIVRLPVGGRTPGGSRAVANGDGHPAIAPEPARLRPAAHSPREGSVAPPTPLRRAGRSASATATVAEPVTSTPPPVEQAAAAPPMRPTVRVGASAESAPRRRPFLLSLPAATIAGGAMVLIVLAVVGVLLAPHLGDVLVDEGSVNMSALPNANAVVAGTPISELPLARPTSAAARPNAAAVAEVAPATAAPPRVDPTSAPTTEAQPTSPPAIVAPVGRRTVLDESFDDNARNWPNNAQGAAWLTGGTYRITTRQAGQFVAIGVPAVGQILQDVVVTASFRKVGGPAGGGYGIIVRDQGPAPRDGVNQQGRYYVLEAGDKGEIGIWRREGDRWVDLLPWQRSDAVKPGSATNELTVKAIGDHLSLSVNGTEVGVRTDSVLAVGNVGIFVGGDGNQVAVDQITIQAP